MTGHPALATLLGVLPAVMLIAGAALSATVAAVRGATRPGVHRLIGALATVAAFTAAMFSLVAMRGDRNGVGAVQFGGGLLVDRFSIYVTVLICAVLLLTLGGSEAYTRRAPGRSGPMVALLLLSAAAVVMLVSEREMGAFSVALALLLVTLVLLTALTKTSSLTAEAALRQLLVGGMGLATSVYGLVLIYSATGSTDLHQLALGYRPDGSRPGALLSAVGVVMVLCGVLVVVGLPPFQQFVRHAVDATPGAIAGFSAAIGLIAGIAVLTRFGVTGFGTGNPRWTVPATLLAAAAMLGGAVLALGATTIRRLIGDLALAQGGFMLLGMVAAGTGIDGIRLGGPTATLYLLTAGAVALLAVLLTTGIFDVAGLAATREAHRAVGRRAPLTTAALALGLLALAGAPPFAGFAGRLLVVGSAVDNGVAWAAVIAMLSLVVGMVAVGRWLVAFYAEETNDPPFAVRTTPALSRVTAWVAVTLGILLAAFAGPLISLAGAGATALR